MLKLEIELVPRTCWYSNVRSEVSPKNWNKIKAKVSNMAGGRCEICSGIGKKWPVECHEVWWYNDSNQRQTLIRMIALCPPCHEVKHFGLAEIRGRASAALAHLRKINLWDLETAEAHVESAFLVWSRRSNVKWALDIAVLEDYLK